MITGRVPEGGKKGKWTKGFPAFSNGGYLDRLLYGKFLDAAPLILYDADG